MAGRSEWQLLFHPSFRKALDSLKGGVERDAVEKKLKNLLQDPHHFSVPLAGPLSGDREIRVLRDLRIIITICRDCRQTEHQKKHRCPCYDVPQNAIIIWWIGNHKELKKAQYATAAEWPTPQ